MARRYIQCDVFSDQALRGNGLAVVVDGSGLSVDQMQRFAIWTQQAETTFLTPPRDAKADYAVRIFSATGEMPFAGHPTLGSCAAWLHCGGVPQVSGRVVQEGAIGLVEVDMTGAVPAFVAPPTALAPMDCVVREAICAALGIAAGEVRAAVRLDNGVVRNLIELGDAARVLALDARAVAAPAFQGVSVMGAHPTGAGLDFEVRNLTPASGMAEDPITGSLIAAIAVWLKAQGRLERDLVMAQGTAMGRAGRVFVSRRGEAVLIGGHSTVVIDGMVEM